MKLNDIVSQAVNKIQFAQIEDYIKFSRIYLEYISKNLSTIIVSQNDNRYKFFQYGEEAQYQITRPINGDLLYSIGDYEKLEKEYIRILENIRDIPKEDIESRAIMNKFVYTTQQTIGAALDGLPAGKSNFARKINGDLFERLIRLIFQRMGIHAYEGTVPVPIIVEKKVEGRMKFQHDLIIDFEGEIKIIGSMKTSSKDRFAKIFIEKFLYSKLTETQVPHIAIFLNDVQRKPAKKENEYSISSTFLPGHFKGFSIKLNPLDGVYYCDVTKDMVKNEYLNKQIKTFDFLLFEDLWEFLGREKRLIKES